MLVTRHHPSHLNENVFVPTVINISEGYPVAFVETTGPRGSGDISKIFSLVIPKQDIRN